MPDWRRTAALTRIKIGLGPRAFDAGRDRRAGQPEFWREASPHLRPKAARATYPARPASSAGALPELPAMPQTQSKFFDDLSRLMTDAAGLAEGARREAQTFARTQMERMMAGMDVVKRDEFEAVKEMAARARDENEKLASRIAALEARLG